MSLMSVNAAAAHMTSHQTPFKYQPKQQPFNGRLKSIMWVYECRVAMVAHIRAANMTPHQTPFKYLLI